MGMGPPPGSPFAGPSGTQTSAAAGLPFAGVPAELEAKANEILEREPKHPDPQIDFDPVHPGPSRLSLTQLFRDRWGAVAIALLLLERRRALSTDALLGILSHSALALGLVMVAFMTWIRIDLMGFLFGDILAVSRLDIAFIYGGGAIVLAGIAWLWRPLLAATVNAELAEAEGLHPERSRFVFMLLMALVIAIAMKIVGILLITSLMIIPAATARRFAATPEGMAVLASVAGAAAVVAGLFGSLELDTPSGPSIVVAALFLFVLTLLPFGRRDGQAAEDRGQ